MKALYFVFGIISLVIISPLGAEEKSDIPIEPVSESDITLETNPTIPEMGSKTYLIDTADPVVRLRIDASEKIAVLEQMDEFDYDNKETQLQKEIETIKINTEIKILNIHLEKAREAKDEDLIEEITTAIDNLMGVYTLPLAGNTEERKVDIGTREKKVEDGGLPPPPPDYIEKEKKSAPVKIIPVPEEQTEMLEEEVEDEDNSGSNDKGGAK